ncbi:hypothetical protein M404DRAFT_999973 [Pisolithus tinctorius Marx 270]|uniref:Methyltransferase type 11 domain-containing protein n=1 Tax=Pisolithus tinctorius Marx 270 TaxID=870435 RepID=A0A0C3PCE2_PISTI|nr:hypothetical protein M404DRAFT_999973 [Pisolithus tinctorius Marx 270]
MENVFARGHSILKPSLDYCKDAIAQARRTATAKGLRPPRVAFVHVLQTDELPVLSDSVDCVVSMWSFRSDSERQEEEKLGNEIWRVVKPGGRVVLSMKDVSIFLSDTRITSG